MMYFKILITVFSLSSILARDLLKNHEQTDVQRSSPILEEDAGKNVEKASIIASGVEDIIERKHEDPDSDCLGLRKSKGDNVKILDGPIDSGYNKEIESASSLSPVLEDTEEIKGRGNEEEEKEDEKGEKYNGNLINVVTESIDFTGHNGGSIDKNRSLIFKKTRSFDFGDKDDKKVIFDNEDIMVKGLIGESLPELSREYDKIVQNVQRLVGVEDEKLRVSTNETFDFGKGITKEAEDDNFKRIKTEESVGSEETGRVSDVTKERTKQDSGGEKILKNISRNGGIENNLRKREDDEVLSTENVSPPSDTKESDTRKRFIKISSSWETMNSTDNENIEKIQFYPLKGTTVNYQQTTFKPILAEELRRKLEHPEEEVQYLPMESRSPGTQIENKNQQSKGEDFEPSEEDVMAAVNFGIRAMKNLYQVKEPALYSMGLFLNPDNPARYVAAFNDQTPEAKELAKYGYAALVGVKKFISKNPNISRGIDMLRANRRFSLQRQCPQRGTPECPPASLRYRTADGSCNNLQNLWWGSAMSTMQRLLPAFYDDGIQSVRRSITGKSLPSARKISDLIHEDRDVPSPSITHMLMQWGQFIDHDITATAQTRGFNGTVPQCCVGRGDDFQPPEFMHPECLPIRVSPRDGFYGRFNIRCLEFVRSGPAPREDCGFGPREQLSQVTSYIDASTVYSSNARVSDSLRLFRNGLLKYGKLQSRKPLLPRQNLLNDLCQRGSLATDCFMAGDGRAVEQPALTTLHVVFLRQHNRIATELAALNPHWSDEKLYQETRRIIIALMQQITYREFLPVVLGRAVMENFDLDIHNKGYFDGYDPSINPNVINSFATAAYRFGHSLVQPSFVRFDSRHRPIPNNVSIHDEFSNPINLQTAGSVDRLLLGLVNQPSQTRDEFITEELTNHLFQTPNFPFGMDLASLNIQRGRDHGIPPYVNWREPCGLSPIRNWEDLKRVMPTSLVRKFSQVYVSVEDIDLFPAGLSEFSVPGGLVGPTFACIIAQQFSNLRKGDRFWFENPDAENSFTPAQLQQLRRVTLSQILCKTMDSIDTIQPFAFLIADDFRNSRLPCESALIGNLDLKPWMERISGRTNSREEAEGISAESKNNEKSFLAIFKPIKTNIHQHNKISVKRPLGSHENLTIVVQNNAVNSPVFVNDAFSGSNFQFTQQTTPGSQKPSKPSPGHGSFDSTSKPFHQGSYGQSEIPSGIPRPIQSHRPSGPYIPHSFNDPSNPNPPNYGFVTKPLSEHISSDVFFDPLTTSTSSPTLYTYYTTFKPRPTRPSKPVNQHDDPKPGYPQGSIGYQDEISRPLYGSSRPPHGSSRPTGGSWSSSTPQYDSHSHSPGTDSTWTHKPVYGGWSSEEPWSNKPISQSDSHGWTNIPSYQNRPSGRPTVQSDPNNWSDNPNGQNKPIPSRPQYWSEYGGSTTRYPSTANRYPSTTSRYPSTTSRYPSGNFYYDQTFQIQNAQANINPRPLKTQSVTIVTETDEAVHYTENKRYGFGNKNNVKIEIPRPLIAEHKDDDVELFERNERRRPGQYYYEKNVLHRYPDMTSVNQTNFNQNKTQYYHHEKNDDSVPYKNEGQHMTYDDDEDEDVPLPDLLDENDDDQSYQGKIMFDSKYQIEHLNDNRQLQFSVNSVTKAHIVQEEVKLTTTATIILDDDDKNDGSKDRASEDYNNYEEADDDLKGAYSDNIRSVIKNFNRSTQRRKMSKTTSSVEDSKMASSEFTSAKESSNNVRRQGT
ncbi:uncharacterized protein LOC107267903 isoform X1 [Cephus cinctus]|uniref:Uncharacterized protein LOC107267903 isoform X1 n=2 Tax=Cephus cinctus TaxID=211228 RepID=A0AAJ7RH15_CEPCN|nr:uncharacterized protein LOC107267903 isoform X1 [Cephus cinctus]XP_024940810.1 uncharacterized protein LOC107267903 isoform X1 [Cephus cinctus]